MALHIYSPPFIPQHKSPFHFSFMKRIRCRILHILYSTRCRYPTITPRRHLCTARECLCTQRYTLRRTPFSSAYIFSRCAPFIPLPSAVVFYAGRRQALSRHFHLLSRAETRLFFASLRCVAYLVSFFQPARRDSLRDPRELHLFLRPAVELCRAGLEIWPVMVWDSMGIAMRIMEKGCIESCILFM